MAKFTEKDNVLEVSFELALNKQAREEVDVYDIVLKHESGSEENTLVDYELSLKESGATLAVKIPKYYFARLGVYSVAVKLSQRDAEALSGRSRIEASQPLCTVISLHRDMESGKTDVELVPFGTMTAGGSSEAGGTTTATFDPATLTREQAEIIRKKMKPLLEQTFSEDTPGVGNIMKGGSIGPFDPDVEVSLLDLITAAYSSGEGAMYSVRQLSESVSALQKKVEDLQRALAEINLLDVARNLVTTDNGRFQMNNIMENLPSDGQNEINWNVWKYYLRNAGEPIDIMATGEMARCAVGLMLSKAFI